MRGRRNCVVGVLAGGRTRQSDNLCWIGGVDRPDLLLGLDLSPADDERIVPPEALAHGCQCRSHGGRIGRILEVLDLFILEGRNALGRGRRHEPILPGLARIDPATNALAGGGPACENVADMTYDIAIVGGGIVGLATGRELLQRHPGLKLILLEKDDVLAKQQTGHNSGVIHSGIYYKPGSLKARLCVEGRKALWTYCDKKGIEYRGVGKLIVATEEHELPLLDDLYQRGLANGIEDLQIIDAAGIAEREPHCRGLRAIFSPVTGIIDYGVVARSYAEDIRAADGEIETGHEVTGIDRVGGNSIVRTKQGDFEAKYVVTCAGLYSDRVAKMTGGKSDPKVVPFRGDYLILKPEKRYLVKGNIYPVPDPNFPFLGVHFTPRINGDIWLGPNAVLAFAREGYSFTTINPADLIETLTYSGFIKLAGKYMSTGLGEMYRDVVQSAYVKALQRYIPELQVEDTLRGPSGVRAQTMMADGSLVDDFVFDGDQSVVHVRNAPSPAATSSLAIGRYIADDADRRFNLGSFAGVR